LPKITIKPRAGFIVRDPTSKQALPPEGKAVVVTSYWARRLASGDVVEVKPAAPKPKSTARGEAVWTKGDDS
jgi:hypothetical protein